MEIKIDKKVAYIPQKEKPLDTKGAIEWPFEYMGSGDSFVIPFGFTLKQVRRAFKEIQLRNPRMGTFHLRAKGEGDMIRVWLFTRKQIDRIESVYQKVS